jgi:hypothetical protein
MRPSCSLSQAPFSRTKSVNSVNHIAIPIPNNNRAGVTLPRFSSQIFTTAARGCSNFNNLRKAGAGRVVTTLEFYKSVLLLDRQSK